MSCRKIARYGLFVSIIFSLGGICQGEQATPGWSYPYVYYGHLHNHCNISDGTGTPATAYSTAKTNGLDFFSLADHGYQMSADEFLSMQTAANNSNQEGIFTSFWGFEWTHSTYGHVAVIKDPINTQTPDNDYCTYLNPSTFTGLTTWLNSRNCVAFFNHPGRNNGSGLEFDHFTDTPSDKIVGMELWNKAELFTVFYYNSGYTSDSRPRSGYFDEAILNEWKIGAAGSEDNHVGTWGTSNQRLAILANQNTRTEIFAALQARRFYSTLDKNLMLSFEVDGQPMGSQVAGGSYVCTVKAADADNEIFTKIELIINGYVADTQYPNLANPVITWNLNNTQQGDYIYCKVTQSDGNEAISSPIFVTSSGPRATWITPADNGPDDLNPAQNAVRVSTTQPHFQILLSDLDGVNDATVTSAVVSTDFANYSFNYDPATDIITLLPTGNSVFGSGSYTVSLAGGMVADLLGSYMPAKTFTVVIDTSLPQTLRFQQSVNGYTGAVDTMLRGDAPNTAYSTSQTLKVDTVDVAAASHGLLRFDNLVGGAVGQIPQGALISSAILRLRSIDDGNGGKLHAILAAWSDTATWDFFISGIQANDIEAMSTVDASIPSNSPGTDSDFNVTARVQAWVNGTSPNRGWAVLPNGTNGWVFASAENATADYRPELIVTFFADSNTKPTVDSQNIATPEDTPVSITLTGTDADNDPLTCAVGTGPAHGTLSGSAPNLIYTPAANFNGTDSFTFTASDGSLVSDPATITLTVNSVNDAPVAQSQSVATRMNTSRNVTLTATDVEGDALTYTVGTPTNGTLTGSAPDLIYTPNDGFYGSDSFTFTASDGLAPSEVATVTITVAENDAPLAVDDLYTVAEDAILSINTTLGILANDSDLNGDTMTAVLVSDTGHGSLVLSSNGSFTYTPDENFNGTDSFTYQAGDGLVSGNTATATITVTAVNDAPVANGQAVTTNEDTSVVIPLTGSDVDNTLLSYAVVTQPTHGTLSGIAPALTYLPAANYNGADSFTFTVSDGVETSDPAGVSITILPQADAPFAGDDAVSTNAGVSVTIPVLANDTDPDGGTLTLGAVGTPGHGTAVGNGDGTITYTPDPGFWGQDSFTYTASDGLLKSAAATVTITIAEPILFSDGFESGNLTAGGWVYNSQVTVDPSAAHIGTYGALLKKTASLQKTINTEGATTVNLEFYARVASLTGKYLFVEWSNDGSNWQQLLSLTGTQPWASYSYPVDSISGTQFMLRFRTNGTSGNQMAMIDDVVIAIPTPPIPNTPPVAADDSYSIAEDGVLSIVASGVLANDDDADGDPLTAAINAGTSHGTLALKSDGSFTYTPNANYSGTDSFTYTASDDKGGSDIATVTLTITSVNDNPVAVNDTATTQQDLFVVINVLANDSDADGDILTVGTPGSPSHGTANGNEDGTITYTPATGFTGPDSFGYTISDGNGGIATGTVSVTVYRINTLPVAVDDSAITDEEQPITISVLANDSDPDGDSLTVTGGTNPANGTAVANGDGSITYNPAANFNGTDSFTYTINDGNGGTATATVHLTVNAVNDNPVAVDDATTTQQDTAVTIGVLSNDLDVEGGSLSLAGVTQPLNGSAMINTDGTITYTPNAGYSGPDSFTYSVSDGNGGSATATVTITIQPVNNNTVSAASIVMNKKLAGKNYFAQAVVTVHDQDGNPVSGAVVNGEWYFNGVQLNSVVSNGTAGDGKVTIDSPKQTVAGTFTFKVTNIVLSGYAYAPGTITEGSITVP